MKVAVGQFAATPDPEKNLAMCCELVERADAEKADLLVLPEGVLARFTGEENRIVEAAQALDGPFVTGLLRCSAEHTTTVVVGIHEATGEDRVFNTLITLRQGEILAIYRKLHLYDAFSARESDRVVPGDAVPPLFECAGWRVGLMTCYDVRFPELARLLADRGAELLVLPAAWVKGPAKERHWELMVAARAVENTCYVAASGECGERNIGNSMVVDPMATILTRLDHRPGMTIAQLSKPDLDLARATLPVLANRRFDLDPTPRPFSDRTQDR